MRARLKLKTWRMALAISLVAAGQVSLHAATSLRTADGALLSVQVVRLGSTGDAPRALAFSIENGSHSRTGYVGRTADRAIDQDPSLILDPRSGNPVLVWSRSDGIALKVAYARFERGAWRDIHFLTFGPGDDLLPSIESSRGGSFLHWSDVDGNAFYAPVDAGSGRFFSAPRELPAPTAPSPSNRFAGGGGGFLADGCHDVPVIIGHCDGHSTDPCVDGHGSSIPINPPPPAPPSADGGTDAPIIVSMVTPPSSSTATASDPGCDSQVVAIASSATSTIAVVRIQPSGEAIRVATLKVAPGIAMSDAATAAATFYLHAACDE